MRLWSLHPSLLDRMGLVALWREALLAQTVLRGGTKGYSRHPQLDRFRKTRDPARAIASFLWNVADEAKARGYRFDESKIAAPRSRVAISVTTSQLAYELAHLKKKLQTRDPKRLRLVLLRQPVRVNRIFRVIEGPIASWERTAK